MRKCAGSRANVGGIDRQGWAVDKAGDGRRETSVTETRNDWAPRN